MNRVALWMRVMRAPLLVGLGGVLLAQGLGQAFAAPQPEVVPRRWQLDVVAGDLRVTTIDVPEVGPRAYFHVTFLVTNNSGEDVNFYPSFDLTTDEMEILRSNRGVPTAVVRRLLDRSSRGHVDLKSEMEAQGLLLQGPEYAREVLVVWPCLGFKVDEVNIFAQGFSGETRTVAKPDTGEPYTLRKTLWLQHEVPGEIDPEARTPLRRTREQWILR